MPGCEASTNTTCCFGINTTFSLAHNGPMYSAYRIGEASEIFTLSITVQQGSNESVNMVLNPLTVETQVVAGLSSTAAILNRSSLEDRQPRDEYLVMQSNDRLDEGIMLSTPIHLQQKMWVDTLCSVPISVQCLTGFLIPQSAISYNTSNSIGMSSDAWSSCFHCNYLGQCSSVGGGPIDDQFSIFRNKTLPSALSKNGITCSILSRIPYSYVALGGLNGVQSVTCQYPQALLSVNVTIDGRIFGLRTFVPRQQAEVTSYNASWLNSTFDKIQVGLFNVGRTSGMFRLVPVLCCWVKTQQCQGLQATASNWVLLQPGQVANIVFYVSTTPREETTDGGCEFALVDMTGATISYVYFKYTFLSILPDGSFNNTSYNLSSQFMQLYLAFTIIFAKSKPLSYSVMVYRYRAFHNNTWCVVSLVSNQHCDGVDRQQLCVDNAFPLLPYKIYTS